MIIVICQTCMKYKHVSGWVADEEFQPRCTCPFIRREPPPPVHWVETEEEMKRPKFKFIVKRVEVGSFDTESIPVDVTAPKTLSLFANASTFSEATSNFFGTPANLCGQPRRSPKSRYWRWSRSENKRSRR